MLAYRWSNTKQAQKCQNFVAMATFSVPCPFNSKYTVLISSVPEGVKRDSICLWQVYACLNQGLLQRFENSTSITANSSHFYELLFIGLELRMLPWKQNFYHYFVFVDSLHLHNNFHLILEYLTNLCSYLWRHHFAESIVFFSHFSLDPYNFKPYISGTIEDIDKG